MNATFANLLARLTALDLGLFIDPFDDSVERSKLQQIIAAATGR